MSGIPKAADEVMAALVDAGRIPEAAPSRPAFPFSRISEVLARPPKETYFANLFGPGDMVMVYGPPGSGKTFLILEMLAAAANGRPFAEFAYTGPGDGLNVLYATGEGEGGLSGRFHALQKSGRLGDNAEERFTVWDKDSIRLVDIGPGMPENLTAKLEAAAAEGWTPDIVAVDTWARATAGTDENDNARIGAVIHKMKTVLERWPKMAIVVVHHSRKGAAETYRGASVVEGAFDLMARIEKGANAFSLQCTKSKDFVTFPAQHFALDGEEGCSAVVRWIDRPQAVTWTQKASADNVLAVLEAEWKANRAPTQTELKAALEEKGIQAAKTRTGEILGEIVKAGKAIEGQRVKSGGGRPPTTWEPPEGWTGDPGEGSE